MSSDQLEKTQPHGVLFLKITAFSGHEKTLHLNCMSLPLVVPEILYAFIKCIEENVPLNISFQAENIASSLLLFTAIHNRCFLCTVFLNALTFV